MKKLNKDQRWVAYVIMLHEAKYSFWQKNGYGMCHLINHVFGLSNDGFFEHTAFISFAKVIELYFPELEKKKGKDWPPKDKEGWQKRIELLKQCINEVS